MVEIHRSNFQGLFALTTMFSAISTAYSLFGILYAESVESTNHAEAAALMDTFGTSTVWSVGFLIAGLFGLYVTSQKRTR